MNIIYLNGEEILNRKIISVYNSSFLYGINCFEGIRGYLIEDRIIFLDLESHLNRFFLSLQRLKIDIKFSKNWIKSHLEEIIEKKNIKENIYIRITAFIDGENSWTSTTMGSIIISLRSIETSLKNPFENRLKSIGISSFRRISENSIPPSIKAGANYINSRYAFLEVHNRGFDYPLL